MSRRARGYNIYGTHGYDFPRVRCVDCMVSDTLESLRVHFDEWARPGVVFIAAVIVPDTPTLTLAPTPEEKP